MKLLGQIYIPSGFKSTINYLAGDIKTEMAIIISGYINRHISQIFIAVVLDL